MPSGRPVVVVAPDSFKGSLPADEAAAAIAAGLRRAGRAGAEAQIRLRPVADGGEGSLEVVLAAGWSALRRTVTGPTGRPVQARIAVSPPGDPVTALVELAEASGLGRLPGARATPSTATAATTYGTGELVRAALDAGARRLVLAIGGSATTDGGAGLAAALGARLLDDTGRPLPPGGAALAHLARIDLSALDPRLARAEIVVACDVDNPLTGPHGAARVYGPQKGATTGEVEALEAGLCRLAEVIRSDVGVDVEHAAGAGAAGGVGAAALALLGARMSAGIDLLLDLADFDRALAGADLVVTGEGRFDSQSLRGKAPVGVARRAHRAGVPVVVLAGEVSLAPDEYTQLAAMGITATHALSDLEPDAARAVEGAQALLEELAARTLPPHLAGTTTATAPTAARSTT